MNTILRSKMEREIGPKWECDYGGLIGQPYARVLAIDTGDVVFRRDGHDPMAYPLRDITHVRSPGGEWLEVVDDPKDGSVWEHDGDYLVVTSYDGEVEYTFYSTNGEQWNGTLQREAFVNGCRPVDSSRIVEGIDGGRLRRFVKTGTFKRGPWQRGEWFLTQCTATPEPEKIQNCNWCWPDGGEREILIPLNFLDPAPCISSVHNETELEGGTKRLAEIIGDGNGWKVVMGHDGAESYVIGERTDTGNGTHWVKWDYYYYGNRCGAFLQMPEPVDYKLPAAVTIISATSPDGTTYRVDGLRVFRACKESLQVGPLSWDANPPMVGDIVQRNTPNGETRQISGKRQGWHGRGDEFKAGPWLTVEALKTEYVRLILSPLHKEAGR